MHPPIANPQEQAHTRSERVPGTNKARVLGAFHIIVGLPILMMGVAFTGLIATAFLRTSIHPHLSVFAMFIEATSLLFCVLGFMLVRGGLRSWKEGNGQPKSH